MIEDIGEIEPFIKGGNARLVIVNYKAVVKWKEGTNGEMVKATYK